MSIKLYGAAHSTCTRRVLTVLHEKNLSYELITINLAANEQASPSFKLKQPFGKVPVLEDTDTDGTCVTVYESRAICRYIAKKWASQGTKLLPDEGNLEAFASFEQACAIETSYFDIPASGFAFEKVFKPWKFHTPPDTALIAHHTKTLTHTLSVYDQILSEQRYLAGDELTLVDLFHLSLCTLLISELGMGDVFQEFASVGFWLEKLQGRESWKKASASNGKEELSESAGVCLRPL